MPASSCHHTGNGKGKVRTVMNERINENNVTFFYNNIVFSQSTATKLFGCEPMLPTLLLVLEGICGSEPKRALAGPLRKVRDISQKKKNA